MNRPWWQSTIELLMFRLISWNVAVIRTVLHRFNKKITYLTAGERYEKTNTTARHHQQRGKPTRYTEKHQHW